MSGTIFDLAVPSDIRVGAGRVAETPDVLAGWGARRVLLVTGRSTERAASSLAALGAAGIDVRTFTVSGEPTIDVVREGSRLRTATTRWSASAAGAPWTWPRPSPCWR